MIGDDSSIFPILFGVWLFELTGAHHANAERTANEILQRAGGTRNGGAMIAGNCAVGISHTHLAKLPDARLHFEKALGNYHACSEAEAKRFAYDYGIELGATSCAYGAGCFWLLGYPDQGLLLGNEALAVGERLHHGYSRVRGLYWNSVFHAFRRDWPMVEQRARAAITLA
jgi:hypothetical protein